jgi:oligoendopeptidase F
MVNSYALVNMLYAGIAGFTVDAFERAIYLDEYDGLGADVIMADGTITADEYDALYTYIVTDFGAEKVLDGYWEYGMTVTSPCYYVSYSVSVISVLQLYEVANTEGFDVAKEQYLKLFTYVDENPEMGMNDLLGYAGMLSFKDEQLYVSLNEYFLKK